MIETCLCWAMLQGFCGLRLYEAVYVREQDLEPGMVRIAESSAHRPKNRSSYRRIPVCAAVEGALREWVGGLKVRSTEGFIFTPSRGSRRQFLQPDQASHRWTEALRQAKADGLSIPPGFTGRKLRATFVTLLREEGADIDTLQRYIGHAPTSILSAHYDRLAAGRIKAIADLAQVIHDRISADVAQKAASLH